MSRGVVQRANRLKPPVPELLKLLGIAFRKSGAEWRGFCPEPSHAARSRKRDSGSWQINADGLHHCFSCGYGGGPLRLVATARATTAAEAAAWLVEHFGDELDPESDVRFKADSVKVTPATKLALPPSERLFGPGRKSADAKRAIGYLLNRGVTVEQLERHRFFATPDSRGAPYRARVIVPVIVRGRIVDFVARLYRPADPEFPKALSGKRKEGALKELALWNYDRLSRSDSTVYVAEGVWGALAIERAGFPNVVATCGSAWSPERTELLAGYERIVLVPDGDEAGESMVTRCSGLRFAHSLALAELPRGEQPDTVQPDELRQVLIGARKLTAFGPTVDSVVSARSWSKTDLG